MSELKIDQSPATIDKLIDNYFAKNTDFSYGELLKFDIPEGYDAYNPTAPFEYQGRQLLAARVEPKDSETDSQTWFFESTDSYSSQWKPVEKIPKLPLQDPYVTRFRDQWLVVGVHVSANDGQVQNWETQFFSGHNLEELNHAQTGPSGMKDIRPLQLPNGKIGVFTRPQGGTAGRGLVGYSEVENIDELDHSLADAPKVEGFINSQNGEWGGVNSAEVNRDGIIQVLGHLARFVGDSDNPAKQYLPVLFDFDPKTRIVANQRIIATRQNFPQTPAKKPDLEEVVFAGGIQYLGSQAVLYTGLSDTSAARLKLDKL